MGQRFGYGEEPSNKSVFVSANYIEPKLLENDYCLPLIDDMLKGRGGCNLFYNLNSGIISFPIVADNPDAFDHCSVRRYAERTDLNATPPSQLEFGQVSHLCERNDTIPLWQLLLKGDDTIKVPQSNLYFVYHLEPAWRAVIRDAPTEYGSRSNVTLEADVTFSQPDATASLPGCLLWTYRVGNGPARKFRNFGEQQAVSFSMQDIAGAKPGDNITIDALGRSENNKHKKIIRFYPELPQVAVPTQTIEPTDSVLRKLEVRLMFPLNADKQEKFTTLTCYKSISVRKDGVFDISESEVLFQTDVSKLITENGRIQIPIPDGKQLTKGTYYITIEGSVLGQSNRPDLNGERFTAETLKAMFPCQTFRVVKNDLIIDNLSILPAKCPRDKGSISFTHSTALLMGMTRY
ncbi:MAG: hypothetical protein K2O01_08195, partial [Bacteroidales bacterium]|nr:hypothetical protein [Bacteroidales bacterium]